MFKKINKKIYKNLNFTYVGFFSTSLMAESRDFSFNSSWSTIFPIPLRSANFMFVCWSPKKGIPTIGNALYVASSRLCMPP